MGGNKKYIQRANELNVYKRLFGLCKVIITKVIPQLPKEERYDLGDQMRRASKSAVAQLAEAYPKRFQIRQWNRYITDILGECEEMETHLQMVKQFYPTYVNPESIQLLIHEYDIAIKQLHKLGKSWRDYHRT